MFHYVGEDPMRTIPPESVPPICLLGPCWAFALHSPLKWGVFHASVIVIRVLLVSKHRAVLYCSALRSRRGYLY